MKKRERIDLNITPLIDIVFILFTFFLVATSFKEKRAKLDIKLPYTNSYKEYKKNNNSIIIILSNDKIVIKNKIINFLKLETYMKKINKNKVIELKIDENVSYKKISNLLNLLKKYKLNNISLITRYQNQYK